MRVVYFSQDYTPHDHRFLSALAGSDHDIHYLRLEATAPPKESRPIPAGVNVIDWWGGRRPVTGLSRLRAAWECRRTLRRLAPDLVHAGPVQSTAALAAAAGAEPLLTMSWGSDLLRGARSGWSRWLARWTLARSHAVAVDCQTVRERALELGVDPAQVFVFPWGVDLARFHPGTNPELRRDLGWGEQHFVMLSTRAWEPLLGIRELVEGFVEAAGQDDRLRLIMLGDGSLDRWVYDRLQRAELLPRVALPGQIENDDLPDYYHASDLYVSASHSDGSSVSLMEALASGVPALVSDIPANREWVEAGEHGWQFSVGDASALARAMVDAARTGQLDKMSSAARARAEARADWDRNFDVLLQAYEFAAGEGLA